MSNINAGKSFDFYSRWITEYVPEIMESITEMFSWETVLKPINFTLLSLMSFFESQKHT